MKNNITARDKERKNAKLTKEERAFLDKLCRDSLFSTGARLSKTDIIGALLNAASLLDISAEGVRNRGELVEKILDKIYSGPDRRRFPRLKKNLRVGFKRIESQEEWENYVSSDINMGGFRVDVAFLGKPLAVSQIIEITISEPVETSRPIKTIGRVAWIRQKEDKHSHEIGISIPYLSKSDEELFTKLLADDVAIEAISEENE